MGEITGEWSSDRISGDKNEHFSGDWNYHFVKLIKRSKLLQIDQEIEKALGALRGQG